MMTSIRKHRGVEYPVSQAHPAADRFPWLDEAELQDLADDVGANGLLDDIVRLPDQRIVDGRNRELACRIAGIEPRYRTESLTEAEIVSLVHSRNIHRRHLSASQRAMIAAELANLPQGFQGVEKPAKLPVTQSEAASHLAVSERSVRDAAKVKEEAPALVPLVKAGTLPVHTAAQVADLPKAQQKAVAESDDPKAEAKKQIAKDDQARRPDPREELIARINKLCHAIDSAKAEAIAIAAEPFGRNVHAESVAQQLEAARKALWQARPTEPCNCVKGGEQPNAKCAACGGRGFTCVGRVLRKGGR